MIVVVATTESMEKDMEEWREDVIINMATEEKVKVKAELERRNTDAAGGAEREEREDTIVTMEMKAME